jgi:hypothetical protein
MQTHTFVTYSFEELSEEAQQTAIEGLYEINVDFEDWSECILDDAREIGKLIGINIKNIYFSGFWSQGDGACFEGYYKYKIGGLKALKEYAPLDKELHRIAKGLQDLQRPHFYRLSATIKQSGHYYHEGCTLIDAGYEVDWDTSDALGELLRDFMRWIYKQLQDEYDYQTERTQIEDTILANDYQFNKEGKLSRC